MLNVIANTVGLPPGLPGLPQAPGMMGGGAGGAAWPGYPLTAVVASGAQAPPPSSLGATFQVRFPLAGPSILHSF